MQPPDELDAYSSHIPRDLAELPSDAVSNCSDPLLLTFQVANIRLQDSSRLMIAMGECSEKLVNTSCMIPEQGSKPDENHKL